MRHLPALLAIPFLVTACSPEQAPVPQTSSGPRTFVAQASSLSSFTSCEDLLDYYQAGALELVGPYGLAGSSEYAELEMRGEDEGFAASESLDSGGDASAIAPGGGSDDFSGTNNQEEGVDEADIVKTNGSIVVAMARGDLQVVDVETQEVVSTLALRDIDAGAYQYELLLHQDTLVVISTGSGQTAPSWFDSLFGSDDQSSDSMVAPDRHQSARTTITRIDISDVSSPEVLGATRMEGSYRSARLIGASVRVVMESDPTGLRFTYPKSGSLSAERAATEANREVITSSTLDDWVPHKEAIGADGNRGEVEPLSDCADVARPETLSGLTTLSVVTQGLPSPGGADGDNGAHTAPTSAVSLVASGDTVYASTDRLIVATSPWGDWSRPFGADRAPINTDTITTSLHSFDISDPTQATYAASGTVEGTLINQFALSEINGVVRVATTTDDPWGGPSEASESTLTVFAEEGNELKKTGSVGGLGKTETIKSVRFLGPDLAAIVTFRQTDPLYLVDTSDPADPQVTGELKIPGYSAYLHPVGDDRLIGIGQDADVETGQEFGLQASLFDISDLAKPVRLDQLTWPGGYSPVEYDHRAFTAWPETGQFFLPAKIYVNEEFTDCGDTSECVPVEPRGPQDNFGGVLTATIDGDGLTEGPQLPTWTKSAEWNPVAERTIVIGDDLWTVHSEGMNRYDLATLDGGPALTW